MQKKICLTDILAELKANRIDVTTERIRQMIKKFGAYSIKKKAIPNGRGSKIFTDIETADKVLKYFKLKNELNNL